MSMQDDIDRRVSEKFEMWLRDSVDLYQRAGLPYEECMFHLIYTMTMAAALAMVSRGVKPTDAHAALDLCLKKALKEHKEMKGFGP